MSDVMTSYNPAMKLGALFEDVAMSGIIRDGKIWVDATPLFPIETILQDYEKFRFNSDFDLIKFVHHHFDMHEENDKHYFATNRTDSTMQHIERLWTELTKSDKVLFETYSKISLPFPYVVPGGRFKEIYYWDSYFTMLGLQISGKWDLIENMVKNFAWLIDHFGFIPNGNRSYYLSRSQPPFFSLMVTLMASRFGNNILLKYLPQLKKEHKFWTEPNNNRVHKIATGDSFVTYYDKNNLPREEMMQSDVEIHHLLQKTNAEFYRNIRAACESGWDFSSRWFENGLTLESIQTLRVVPIDLECLLWHLENTISKACKADNNPEESEYFSSLAQQRRQKINNYFWNEEAGFFCDINLPILEKSKNISLAGLYPLFFNLCDEITANKALSTLEKKFLRPGGLVTTTVHTGQQWDAPNGWAPLQWIGFISCVNYGNKALANFIRERWLKLNDDVFRKTGKMLEKYNVEDLSLEGGGGEYPVQDGFGWTNGVYLALASAESYLKIN